MEHSTKTSHQVKIKEEKKTFSDLYHIVQPQQGPLTFQNVLTGPKALELQFWQGKKLITFWGIQARFVENTMHVPEYTILVFSVRVLST